MRACRLDQVCEITMGQAPSGDAYNDDGEGWPLIAGAGDFGDLYPSPKKYTREASRVSRAGDIVLGIRASIGEKVLADGEYCLGRGVAGFRAGSEIDSRYLWHWLTHIQPVLVSKARGATFLQVNKNDIAELEIKLPPLAQQRRIAAILDRADALRAKRREALAQLDSLTQSIFIEMFGDPATNPFGIRSGSLRSLAEISTGSTPSREREGYFGGHIPWVKTTEVCGEVIGSTEEHLTDAGLHAIRGKLHPPGSIVVAMYGQGQTRGRSGLLEITACCNQACGVIRPSPHFDPLFMFCQLRLLYERLRALGRGGNQENLNLQILGAFEVLVPTLHSQQTFATRIQAIESLKATHRAALAEADALFASLQHRAFTGQLSA